MRSALLNISVIRVPAHPDDISFSPVAVIIEVPHRGRISWVLLALEEPRGLGRIDLLHYETLRHAYLGGFKWTVISGQAGAVERRRVRKILLLVYRCLANHTLAWRSMKSVLCSDSSCFSHLQHDTILACHLPEDTRPLKL